MKRTCRFLDAGTPFWNISQVNEFARNYWEEGMARNYLLFGEKANRNVF